MVQQVHLLQRELRMALVALLSDVLLCAKRTSRPATRRRWPPQLRLAPSSTLPRPSNNLLDCANQCSVTELTYLESERSKAATVTKFAKEQNSRAVMDLRAKL